jgi:hypothetical protein
MASIKDYLNTSAPSSTGVHSNIDNLILEAELNKFDKTGVMYADRRGQYVGGVDPVVENVAMSPILTLKSLGDVGRKILNKTGLRNPVSHYTGGLSAENILKQKKIVGFGEFPGRGYKSGKYAGAVSVTRDPLFASRPHHSIGTDIKFVLDRDDMIKKGFSLEPIAVNNYKKTLNRYDLPPVTLKKYQEIHGVSPNQMNPRFEFEERVLGKIPTDNVKLIDILRLPLNSSNSSQDLLELISRLSKTKIPIIKSLEAEDRLKKVNIKSNKDLENIYRLIKETPTYKFNPFKKRRQPFS